MIKFIKDETVSSNFDVYKSHTVHVPSGEPPGSLSRPPAKRKPGVVRPITQGKLLKAGAPDVGHSLLRRSFDLKFLYRRNHRRHQDRNLRHSLFREGLTIDNLRLHHHLLGKSNQLRLPLPVLMYLHLPRQSNLNYRHTELNLHSKDKKERCHSRRMTSLN